MIPDAFARIDREAIARYNERFKRHGVSPLTLGWGNREQQEIRFRRVLDAVSLSDKHVLDIGCGFADFHAYCLASGLRTRSYTGIDINSTLLQVSADRFPDATFVCGSPTTLDRRNLRRQVGVMLGLLNFRQAVSNIEYSAGLLESAFDLCQEILVFDALSACRSTDYPEESSVFYYEPADILRLSLRLTPYVSIHHDYQPIPQREMLVVLRRTPCD